MLDRSRSPRHHISGSSDAWAWNGNEEQGEGDLLSIVANFVAENGLDTGAADALSEQSEQVQRSIMAEGPVTGRNVNAILMARIRRTKAAHERGGDRPQQTNYSQVPQYVADRPKQSFAAQGAGDAVCRFVEENSLDMDADSKLRSQSLEVQQIVISEGKLTGRNTSAVLGGRIKRTVDGLAQSQQGDAVSMFCAENGIDAGAEQNLRDQDHYVVQAVLSEGPCTGRNTSAILTSRIRRIIAGSGSAPPQQMWAPQPAMHGYSNAQAPQSAMYGYGIVQAPQPALHGKGRYDPYGMSPVPMWSPGPEQAVHAFCAENDIDGKAFSALMEAPPHIQQAIMQEGHITGRNKSAILLSRLRRAEAYAPPDPVSMFIAENYLDQAAEQRLRELSFPVQQAVLCEGPLVGARNPSAVLFARIKRVEQNSAFAPPPRVQRSLPPPMRAQPAWPVHSSPFAKQINDFIVENSINEDVAAQLYEADPRIQKGVMEEGALTGRNPSAVLLSRIRRATL